MLTCWSKILKRYNEMKCCEVHASRVARDSAQGIVIADVSGKLWGCGQAD